MEHVLFLEDKQFGKDLLDCSECRLDICNPCLNVIMSRDAFELLVSKLFMVNPSLISGPALTHPIQVQVGHV